MTRIQARARTRTACGWSWPRAIGVAVDLRRPRAGVSAVVGEGRDRGAEAFVAGPPEVHRAVFAGLVGHRAHPGQGGYGVRAVVGCAGVAPLGEHLGGVDPTRPWQRREDLRRPGAPRGGRCTDRSRSLRAAPSVRAGRRPGRARRRGRRRSRVAVQGAGGCGAQPGQQLGGGAAAGVAVLDAECVQAFLAQVPGVARRSGSGSGTPTRSATRCRRRSLWRRASARRAARRAGWSPRPAAPRCRSRVRTTVRSALVCGRVRDGRAQPVRAQPQVLGDHRGVPGVGLGAGEHLARRARS